MSHAIWGTLLLKIFDVYVKFKFNQVLCIFAKLNHLTGNSLVVDNYSKKFRANLSPISNVGV